LLQKGERDRRIEYEVSHGLPLGLTHCFKGLGKSVAVRKIIVK